MIKNLKFCPYGKCKAICYNNGDVVLRSYATDVILLTADGWLTCYGTYSATTRKHIGAFMKEYCNSCYQVAKAAFLGGYSININTGEIAC